MCPYDSPAMFFAGATAAFAIRGTFQSALDPSLERPPCIASSGIRRQVFWNQCALKLRESLAHLVGLIMQRAGGDASAALRVSFV